MAERITTYDTEHFLWREEYSIGIADIDTQHQRLLGLLHKLNAINEHIRWHRTGYLMLLLENLNEYAAYHFLSEEALMHDHLVAADHAALHIAAHRSYWRIISEFNKRHKNGDSRVEAELLEFLNGWWLNHILQTDQQMGRELNQLGIN